jgi:hypothetical protein
LDPRKIYGKGYDMSKSDPFTPLSGLQQSKSHGATHPAQIYRAAQHLCVFPVFPFCCLISFFFLKINKFSKYQHLSKVEYFKISII